MQPQKLEKKIFCAFSFPFPKMGFDILTYLKLQVFFFPIIFPMQKILVWKLVSRNKKKRGIKFFYKKDFVFFLSQVVQSVYL